MGLHDSFESANLYSAVKSITGYPPSSLISQKMTANIVLGATVMLANGGGGAKNIIQIQRSVLGRKK